MWTLVRSILKSVSAFLLSSVAVSNVAIAVTSWPVSRYLLMALDGCLARI